MRTPGPSLYALPLLLVALVLSASCNKLKGGTSPSDFGPSFGTGGDNNGPGCGPFGQKVYLKDDNGRETKMWVILHWVRPACGTKVEIQSGWGPVAGFPFNYRAELGYDEVEYRTSYVPQASLAGFFSLEEGVPQSPFSLSGVGVIDMGTSVTKQVGSQVGGGDTAEYLLLTSIPKFIVVMGEVSGNFVDPNDAKEGIASFGLHYRE